MFLGFLKGVPFFWVIQNVWFIWLPAIAMVLLAFYFFDTANKKETQHAEAHSGKIEISGRRNFVYLGIIVISVFLDPAVLSFIPSLSPFPLGIREIIMFSVSFLAFKRADEKILRANEFDFEPIKEVAYLFIGIFATMIPALQLIAYEAKVFGNRLDAGSFLLGIGYSLKHS